MLDNSRGRKGFTLVELLVIVVIVGVLASFAIPGYIGVRKKIQDYGAKSSLKLIQAAEKSYRIEARQYLGCANTTDCNAALKTDIAVSGYWEYEVPKLNNNLIPPEFCAEANNTTSARFWHIDQDDPEAASGTCP